MFDQFPNNCRDRYASQAPQSISHKQFEINFLIYIYKKFINIDLRRYTGNKWIIFTDIAYLFSSIIPIF